jgi:hypothetical protein
MNQAINHITQLHAETVTARLHVTMFQLQNWATSLNEIWYWGLLLNSVLSAQYDSHFTLKSKLTKFLKLGSARRTKY